MRSQWKRGEKRFPAVKTYGTNPYIYEPIVVTEQRVTKSIQLTLNNWLKQKRKRGRPKSKKSINNKETLALPSTSNTITRRKRKIAATVENKKKRTRRSYLPEHLERNCACILYSYLD